MKSTISRGIAATLLLGAVCAPASAAIVAVWQDPAYVDVAGGAFSEGLTIAASLTAAGHTVVSFTGTSGAAWGAALTGVEAVVIPETEPSDSTFVDLSAGGGAAALSAYVTGGGGLITSLDRASGSASDSVLNGVFGLGLTATGASFGSLDAGAAAGTAFAGGPASIPNPSATLAYTAASVLAAGGTGIYLTGAGHATVALFGAGSGRIAALGWDWFNAAPLGPVDGGWLEVLDRAVTHVAGASVPEPATVLMLGVGLVGLAAGARRRA